MSKSKLHKFDNKSLDINREINEEIGKLKYRINYTYSLVPKNTNKNKTTKIQEKNKRNKSNKKITTSSIEGTKDQKIQVRKNSNHYSSISKDSDNIKSVNSKETLNVLRAKVIKKKNFDHVERVVIDLVNNYDIDTYKTESVASSNIYENEIINKIDNKSTDDYENLNNKDNNVCINNVNDISIAINMIESRWKNNCTSNNEISIPVLCDEISRKKKEMQNMLNRWNNNAEITKTDKLSIFNDNNIMKKWKKNEKIIKESNIDFLVDELNIKQKKINNILNRWNNNIQITKGDKISFLVDSLKIKEKEMNNIINRWLNNQKINNEKISFLVNALNIKKKEIEKIKNRWNNDAQEIKGDYLSFLVDTLEIKKKENEKIKNKWNNNNQVINEEYLSFLVDALEIKKKEMNTIINKWVNNNQKIDNEKISFLVDVLDIKKKEIEKIKNRWNNDARATSGESLTFSVDDLKMRQKELENLINRWKNNNKTENILFSIEAKKDKESFNYSKKNYINNLLQTIYISENNNNNYIVLNNEYPLNNNINKINYKIIKPNNKNELELALFNIYNENINSKYEKSDDVNNNFTEVSSNKESFINPIFVLNDEQLKQLYKEFNSKIGNKKEWDDIKFTICKQIGIDYEIIDPYPPSDKNNYSYDIEKLSEVNINKEKKIFQDFEQNTPISMLNEKFYVYAVSRNIKYSILSSQPNINYINNNSKLKKKNCIIFDKSKLMMNHFRLWIEKIDKINSYRSLELNETLDKK